jgi:hypothetical protein
VVGVNVKLAVSEGVSDTLSVELAVTDDVDDNETDADGLWVGVELLVLDRVGVTEIVCVAVAVKDFVGVRLGVGVTLCVRLSETVTEMDGVLDADSSAVLENVGVTLYVRENVGDDDGVLEDVGDLEKVRVRV